MNKLTLYLITMLLIATLIIVPACGPSQYQLTCIVAPEGSGLISPAGGLFAAGTRLTLVATPAEGYRFERWEGSVNSTSSSIELTMDAAKSVTARFIAQHVLSTSVTPDDGGKVTPAGNKYDEGTQIKVSAEPASGYIFDRWSGDVSDTAASINIAMNNSKAVTAHFKKIQFSLNTSVNPDNAGTIKPSGGLFDYGIEVSLSAQPSSGYRFDHWSGDVTGNSSSPTVTINGNKSVTANFITQHSLTALTNPEGAGKVISTPVGGAFDDGAAVTITAEPASGYRFDHWSGDAAGNLKNTSVTMNGNKSITAHFIKQYTLSISIKPEGSGKVSPAGGVYDEGEKVTLTAESSPGFHFQRWTGPVTDTLPSIVVSMDYDRNIQAQFIAEGPAKIQVSITDPIPCSPVLSNGLKWTYSVKFKESNGVEATVERVTVIYLDNVNRVWYSSAGKGSFEAKWLIPAGGEYVWNSSFTDYDTTDRDDFRGATVQVSYEGHDANGNPFSGFVSGKFSSPLK